MWKLVLYWYCWDVVFYAEVVFILSLWISKWFSIVPAHGISDYLDIVKDPISSGDYRKEEDPKLFVSKRSPDRGPLNDNWRQEYIRATGDPSGNSGKAIMCAYKLCRVEFRYWGMQSKIERFIHDIGKLSQVVREHFNDSVQRREFTWIVHVSYI